MPSQRIPLQWDNDYRWVGVSPDQSFGQSGKDATNNNVMYEKRDAGLTTRQRPGIFSTEATGMSGTPQGLYNYKNVIWAIVNDTLKSVGAGGVTGTDGTAWTTASASAGWMTRAYGQVVNFNNSLYLVGGFRTGGAQGDVWCSTDGGVTWNLVVASAPFGARQGHSLVVFNGNMYLLGGYYTTFNTAISDVWVTSDGANWSQLIQNAGWGPRAYAAALATTGGIYIMGGTTAPILTFGGSFTTYNDVWFSADGQTWTQVTPAAGAAWTVRAGFDCIFFNNQFVLVGGINPSTLAKNNQAWFSTDAANWTQATAAALGIGAQYGAKLCTYAGKMWAVGGSVGVDQGTTHVYSSTNPATWTDLGPGLTGGRACGGIAVAPVNVSQGGSTSIFYVGGFNAGAGLLGSTINGTMNSFSSSFTLTPPVSGQPYDFQEFNFGNALIIKNASSMFVLQDGQLVQVTDTRYPTSTVPGVVALGGFLYVMDKSGLIYNCDFNNPQLWPGQNYIGADYEPDGGVAISKYLNYLVAFGTRSIQMFYDAGTPVGSPLLPYLAGNQEFGCEDGLSVINIGGNVYWYGNDQNKYSGISTFNGLKAQIISPEPYNKILNFFALFNNGLWRSLAVASGAHEFFIYPLNAQGISSLQPGSLVYHINMNRWYLWQGGFSFDVTNSGAMAFQSSTGGLGTTFFTGAGYPQSAMLSADGTRVCAMFDILGYDFVTGTPTQIANCFVRSPPIDMGNRRMKAWGRQDVIGDVVPIDGFTQTGTPALIISAKDDDSASTTGLKVVDMSQTRPTTFQWGASRRRSFQVVWSNLFVPMRVEALEQEYEQGS